MKSKRQVPSGESSSVYLNEHACSVHYLFSLIKVLEKSPEEELQLRRHLLVFAVFTSLKQKNGARGEFGEQ